MTNNQLTDLRTLILSEVGDFFAGFGSPGEPRTPEEMQRELSMRLGRILNDHIVNYPRCEALVEILRECRIARDEAQAELQERRKADSEPVAVVEPSDYVTAAQFVGEGHTRKAVHELYEGALRIGDKLYRHAQQPVVLDRSIFEKWWESQNGSPLDGWDSLRTIDGYCDDGIDGQFEAWNACRAAMLAAAPQEVKSES